VQGLSPNRLWSVGHKVKGSLMTLTGVIGLAALASLLLTCSFVDTTKDKKEDKEDETTDK